MRVTYEYENLWLLFSALYGDYVSRIVGFPSSSEYTAFASLVYCNALHTRLNTASSAMHIWLQLSCHCWLSVGPIVALFAFVGHSRQPSNGGATRSGEEHASAVAPNARNLAAR